MSDNTIITVVRFNAYDRAVTEAFYDKTPEQMHTALKNICSTYEPLSIQRGIVTTHEPLNILTSLIKADRRKEETNG